MTQNNLGSVYLDMPTGNRQANLQKAIECYTAALRVQTETDLPQEWATTQHNQGNVYLNLATGDRQANLQKAIECYTAALRVRTETDLPREWAETHQNLAFAYAESDANGFSIGNTDDALSSLSAAVRGFTTCGLTEKAKGIQKAIDRFNDEFGTDKVSNPGE